MRAAHYKVLERKGIRCKGCGKPFNVSLFALAEAYEEKPKPKHALWNMLASQYEQWSGVACPHQGCDKTYVIETPISEIRGALNTLLIPPTEAHRFGWSSTWIPEETECPRSE